MSHRVRVMHLFSIFVLICSLFLITAPPQLTQAQPEEDPWNTGCETVPINSSSPTPNGNCFIVDKGPDDYAEPFVPSCNNIPGDGDCSLRSALVMANQVAGTSPVRIVFEIPAYPSGTNGYQLEPITVEGVGIQQIETWTILLSQPLDAITRGNITIDGFTQERNRAGTQNDFGPPVIIDGSALTLPSGGFTIRSSNNTIRGLGIVGFDKQTSLAGVGIEITDPDPSDGIPVSGNVIEGCYIGVDKVGQNAQPNYYGIWLNASGNRIGELLSTNGKRNLISGNLADGVLITASNNQVRGNYIGLNRRGERAIPNGASGVAIRLGGQNIIGSSIAEGLGDYGNVISGNVLNGVAIYNGSTNQVMSNLIGTDATGSVAVPNREYGVDATSSTDDVINNLIGAPSNALRNYISGNNKGGIRFAGTRVKNNQARNNYIGPSKDGYTMLTGAYTQTGVIISNGADFNSVGGLNAGEGNVISANYGYGVHMLADPSSAVRADGNKILGNIIGLTPPTNVAFPQGPLGNRLYGIYIEGNKGPFSNTEIRSNTISANGFALATGQGHGVYALNNESLIENTTFTGNLVGQLGTLGNPGNPASNNGDGIRMTNGTIANTVFGTGDSAQRNIVSNNIGHGIYIVGSSVPTLTMLLTQVESNLLSGIVVGGASNVTIAGTEEVNALIQENGVNGIEVNGATVLDITYIDILKNGRNGVRVSSAISPTLLSNIIDENGWNGIAVLASSKLRIWLNKLNYNGGIGLAGNGIYLSDVTTGNIGGNEIFYSGYQFNDNQPPIPNPNCVITDPVCNGIMIEAFDGVQDILFGVSDDVQLPNIISQSLQYGGYVAGPALQVQFYGNDIMGNLAGAVKVGDGQTPPTIASQYNEISAPNRAHPQRVTIRLNRMKENGGAITLDPNDTPVIASAPNHDINAPFNLRMKMDGSRIYGQLLNTSRGIIAPFQMGEPTACLVDRISDSGCVIDVYKMETFGQGYELLATVPLSEDGSFEAIVNLGEPEPLALTATDLEGNTSEFAIYQPFGSLQLVPSSPTLLSGYPDDVLTYTFTITNNGNIDFDSISLTAGADRDWSGFFTFVPSTTFPLQSLGMSQTVTVTAQIPPGGNLASLPSPPDVKITVKAVQNYPVQNKVEAETDVFAQVLGRFHLTVTPLPPLTALNFLALPGTSVQQIHVVTNTGNLTGTVTITATTDRGSEWQGADALTPTVTLLAPGQSTQVTVVISVPTGTLSGTTALTTVRFDTDGPPPQQRIITNTTTATRNTGAIMYRGIPNDRPGAGALEEVCRPWVVENTSSGAATFQLTAGTRFNSQVTFKSATGQPLLDNKFNVGIGLEDRDFIYLACIKMSTSAQTGQVEEVTIYLTDEGGVTRATGQMFIDVLRPTLTLTPRVWLPLVAK